MCSASRSLRYSSRLLSKHMVPLISVSYTHLDVYKRQGSADSWSRNHQRPSSVHRSVWSLSRSWSRTWFTLTYLLPKDSPHSNIGQIPNCLKFASLLLFHTPYFSGCVTSRIAVAVFLPNPKTCLLYTSALHQPLEIWLCLWEIWKHEDNLRFL